MGRGNPASEPARAGGTIDALEPPCPIERMQAAPRPQWPGPQHGLDPLLEPLVVEPDDFGKTERPTIAIAAILERTDQLAAALDDPAAWPRGCDIDQNRIAPVRLPRTKEIACRPQMERVGV